MRPSAWARKTGLSYKTPWRLWKTGKLALPTEQPTGTVIVHERPVQTSDVVLYGRAASSADLHHYGKRAPRRNRVGKARKVLL